MSFTLVTHRLTGDTPGTDTELYCYTAGPEDAATKVHLQAALHADEQPGTMALHHLLPMLRDADAAGKLKARFTLFPSVNPLGLANLSLRNHIGRYDTNTGINYNRRWPDLYPAIAEAVAERLTEDPATNVKLLRQAVINWCELQTPASAAQELRLVVLRSAVEADIVLDLHCDSDSLKHIFTSPEMMPGLQDLADCMGVAATLTAEDSGGGSFDEMLPQLYRKAARANPGRPIPLACETATLEYRGQIDVFDAIGIEDAEGLFAFFVRRGLIESETTAQPAPAPAATPFEATEVLRTPHAGLLAYRVELGEMVRKGQPIADLIAMDGPEAFIKRTPLLAGTDGFVLSRSLEKYAPRGAGIAKIVGKEPLPTRVGGYLLED